MNKEYVCTIDHAKFNTEEALIKHLLSNFSMSQENGDDKSDILKMLQSAFPEALIEIIKREDLPKDSLYVSLNIPEYNADFGFYITKNTDNNYFYGEATFKSVEEAIDTYRGLLEEKDKLINDIKNKFSSEKVVVNQIYEAGYDNDGGIIFVFYVNGQKYHGAYHFDGIENCLKKLEGYFTNVVEGECVTDFGGYDSENTVYVDGIDIKHLVERAKKLRVEIIETK